MNNLRLFAAALRASPRTYFNLSGYCNCALGRCVNDDGPYKREFARRGLTYSAGRDAISYHDSYGDWAVMAFFDVDQKTLASLIFPRGYGRTADGKHRVPKQRIIERVEKLCREREMEAASQTAP